MLRQLLGAVPFLDQDPGDDLLDGFTHPPGHLAETALKIRVVDHLSSRRQNITSASGRITLPNACQGCWLDSSPEPQLVRALLLADVAAATLARGLPLGRGGAGGAGVLRQTFPGQGVKQDRLLLSGEAALEERQRFAQAGSGGGEDPVSKRVFSSAT